MSQFAKYTTTTETVLRIIQSIPSLYKAVVAIVNSDAYKAPEQMNRAKRIALDNEIFGLCHANDIYLHCAQVHEVEHMKVQYDLIYELLSTKEDEYRDAALAESRARLDEQLRNLATSKKDH